MFLGMLGPEKVIMLMENAENFEWPSDLGGVHPIEYDQSGQWKERLKRQLDNIGYELLR